MKIKLLSLAVISFLAACGGEPTNQQPIKTQTQQSQVQTGDPVAALPIIDLNYADYLASANSRLRAAKIDLQLPATAIPVVHDSTSKKMFHDFSDGLSIIVMTNNNEQLNEVRVVWNTDVAGGKAKQWQQAAAALLAATAPEDRTLERDAADQIKMAIESHNSGSDPTRTFARGGVAYKITVTNLPSVVLTAKPE